MRTLERSNGFLTSEIWESLRWANRHLELYKLLVLGDHHCYGLRSGKLFVSSLAGSSAVAMAFEVSHGCDAAGVTWMWSWKMADFHTEKAMFFWDEHPTTTTMLNFNGKVFIVREKVIWGSNLRNSPTNISETSDLAINGAKRLLQTVASWECCELLIASCGICHGELASTFAIVGDWCCFMLFQWVT